MTATLAPNTLAPSNVVIVKVPKRVDAAVMPALTKDLDEKIQTGRKVILDFSQTGFIHVEATDVFLEGLVKATQRNARLSLRGVRPGAKMILDRGGVLEHFRRTR